MVTKDVWNMPTRVVVAFSPGIIPKCYGAEFVGKGVGLVYVRRSPQAGIRHRNKYLTLEQSEGLPRRSPDLLKPGG